MNKHLTAFRSKFDNVAASARNVANKAAVGGTALMASGAAFAQGAGDVEAVISTQLALALAIVVAGTIALLTIRYSKMARRA